MAVAKKCRHCGKWLEGEAPVVPVQQNANPAASQNVNYVAPPSDRSKGGLSKIIIIAVIALLLIGGGAFYYMYTQRGSLAEVNQLFAQGKNEEAMKMMTEIAENGDVSAQYHLGMRYKNGEGTEMNRKEAFKWLKLSADAGSDSAQYSLAYFYLGDYKDYDECKDVNKGIAILEKLAEKDLGESARFMANLYFFNKYVPEDLKKAEFWAKKFAELHKYDYESCWRLDELAIKYLKEGNDYKGFELALIAAEHGNPWAQYRVGVLYFNGEGTERNFSEARKWFKKAADYGITDAKKILRKYF